jgi:hypothetical protein
MNDQLPQDAETYKPSQVVLDVGATPLAGTMGRAEREQAATLIVRACQFHGDTWQPIVFSQIQRTMFADVETETKPLCHLVKNPFFKPNAYELVEHGFARWTEEPGGPIELTAKALEVMRKWVRR